MVDLTKMSLGLEDMYISNRINNAAQSKSGKVKSLSVCVCVSKELNPNALAAPF